MTKKEKFGCFTVTPTDYRMTAKRHGFEWAIRVHHDHMLAPHRLVNVTSDHLGNYFLLPLKYWSSKNTHTCKFMVNYGRYNKNSYVYFRTREEALTVLSLYAMKHGTFE